MAKLRASLLFLGFINFVIFIHGLDGERYYIPTQEHFVAQQSQALFHQQVPDGSIFGLPNNGHGTASASASAASSAFSFGLGPTGLNNQFFGGAFGLGFGFGGGWYPPSQLIPNIGQGRPSDFNVPTLLKPSDTGWDTSYNVPCGSYKIRPFVIANLRLGTSSSPFHGRRRRSSPSGFESELKQSERSNFPYFPTQEPKSCSWDFNSDGPCKLKFKCVWFQLPALFSCTENYLLVSDSTTNLNSTFCGNRKPRKVYNSSSGKLILLFRSQTSSLPSVFDCAVTCTLEAPANGGSSTEVSDDKPQSSSKLIALQVKDAETNSTSSIVKEKSRVRIGNCKCGVQDGHYSTRERIVGGTKTFSNEFPWVAALVKKPSTTSRSSSTRPFCAATLISDRYVITAAHCVLNNKIIREPRSISGDSRRSSLRNPKDLFDVLLIENDINQLDGVPGGRIRVAVDKIIVHPNYDNVTFHFDVALLRLEKPIDFGLSITNYQYNNDFDFNSERRRQLITEADKAEARSFPSRPTPICLPLESDLSLEDNYGIITGWGLQTEGGIPSETLLKATVQIFNDTICKELYKEYNYPITESMICAGYLNGKIDSCVGDSGGGLVMETKNRYYLAGITSWGRGCGRKRQPGVYTQTLVPGLIEWIRSEANDGVWCV